MRIKHDLLGNLTLEKRSNIFAKGVTRKTKTK